MNKKYYLLSLYVAIAAILFDLGTKLLVVKYLENKTLHVIPNFFSLSYSVNFGAIFGTMKGMLPLFLMVTVVFLIIIFYAKEKLVGNKPLCVAYGLIVGGALGNMIDRLFIEPVGAVTDFLDFHLTVSAKLFAYPIFNFADVFILVGVILFLLKYKGKKEDGKKD